MPFGFLFLDQPYEQLDELEADPERADLLAAVSLTLRDIAAAEIPDGRLGTTTWVIDNEDGHLVAKITPVPLPRLVWRIVWHAVSDHDIEVIYIGPA